MSDEHGNPDSVTRYAEPGIEERHGIVPTWLAVVYVVMFVWMIWYTVVYWTNKG
jgi:hypothetical protein